MQNNLCHTAPHSHNGLYHRPYVPVEKHVQQPRTLNNLSPYEERQRHAQLSQSIDQIINTFGSDSIHFGCTSEAKSKYVGTKIAFNRIPDAEEFM